MKTKPLDKIREDLEKLETTIKETEFMNADRKEELLLLINIIQDILLAEEITQSFFKDIRGGKAI